MYCVIYQFIILENKTEDFIKHWTSVTKGIYKKEGSLGSRLHRADENTFIAYAQWPSKEVYDASGNNLSEESKLIRKNMRDCCLKIETLHTLDMVSDLLQKDVY